MSEIDARLKALRQEMQNEHLDAYFIFGTDPHMSEYVAERWKDREWISGFTGSAGTVVVTAEAAGLWTDSRYHLQAEQQLDGSGITLFKEGLPGVPSIQEWIAQQVAPGATAGADGSTLSLEKERSLKSGLAKYGIIFRSTPDLLDRVWTDRPAVPQEDIFQHDVKYAGADRRWKIEQVQKALETLKCDFLFLSSLSDIAWLCNLRGNDIAYNPLFVGYALIGLDSVFLAVDQGKLSDELASLLEEEGIRLVPYASVADLLQEQIRENERVAFDPAVTSSKLAAILHRYGSPVERMDVTTEMKAIKGQTEIEGLRHAMVKDGAAMVQFLYWISHAWEAGNLTELSIGEALPAFRSRQDGFMGESFHPIVGFRDHGAVIHYSATEESSYTVDGPGLLLVDSGGHYLDGTTDITRTIALGEPDQQQREDYTTVLKGHIDLAMARFPEGTRGFQLDTKARAPLWDRGMQYGHGTGHGVGFFLNVHEGPQRISTHPVDVAIQPGMVSSNEPGLYREGRYGIRIENLILSRELFTTPFGNFFGFESLTLCPLDPKLIDPQLLTPEQVDWVNSYHRRVCEALSPHLGRDERSWLEQQTSPISR